MKYMPLRRELGMRGVYILNDPADEWPEGNDTEPRSAEVVPQSWARTINLKKSDFDEVDGFTRAVDVLKHTYSSY